MRYPNPHEIIDSMSVASYRWKGWELVSVQQFGELSMNSFSIVYQRDNVKASYHGRIGRGKGMTPWIMTDTGGTHVMIDPPEMEQLPLLATYGKHTDEILALMRMFPSSLITFIDNEMEWDDPAHVFGYLASTDNGIVQGYLPLIPTDYDEYKAGPIETNPIHMYVLSINESDWIIKRLHNDK